MKRYVYIRDDKIFLISEEKQNIPNCEEKTTTILGELRFEDGKIVKYEQSTEYKNKQALEEKKQQEKAEKDKKKEEELTKPEILLPLLMTQLKDLLIERQCLVALEKDLTNIDDKITKIVEKYQTKEKEIE